MNNRNAKYILICILCALIHTSCSDWLEVKPYDKIGEDELFDSEAGFEKLLNGIYIELNSDALYGGTLGVEALEIMGGAYSIGTDNTVWGNFKDLANAEYTTEYWRGRFNSTWDKAYALILNCNQLLTNLDKHRELFSETHYNIFRGEALALRAMLHFDLLRLFGPIYKSDSQKEAIPYYTVRTTTPEQRLTAAEVMDYICNDLREARILLSEDPIRTEGTMMSGTNDGTSNFYRYRPLRLNYVATTALLARVSMYAGQRKEAFDYALEVIKTVDAGIFSFVDKGLVTGSPEDPDRIFSSEVIFALSNTNRNMLFKNYFDPNRLPNYVLRMDNELMSQRIFGGGAATGGNQDDYRYRMHWVATGANKYFYKYADMNNPGRIENTMIPLVRLGEMYLIAAETQSDNLGNGVSYLNALRRNRGINSLSTLNAELLTNEYIRELYGEGQLFYFYKRRFEPVVKSAISGQNTPPSEKLFCVPLPDTETDN